MVDDLTGLLDYLQVGRALLVAQSMGGVSCLGFALAHPERVSGLALADTTGGIGDASVISLLADAHPPEGSPAPGVERRIHCGTAGIDLSVRRHRAH